MIRFFFILVIIFPAILFAQDQTINPNGYNMIYYPNGSLQSEGKLVNGKPEGYWINYYPTGVIKSEGQRKNFKLDSIWIFYAITGDTLKKISYLNGKKNGYSNEYFTKAENPAYVGNLKSKELYVEDKKAGPSYYYYEEGLLKEKILFDNNKRDGNGIEYAKDGRIITVYKYRKGILLEREKINRYNKERLKHLVWKEFYSGLKVKSERYFQNGLLDGYYKEYDQSGTLILTHLYRDGKMLQDVTETEIQSTEKVDYFDDGSIKSSGFYVKDKPIGMHKEYDREGNNIRARIYNDFSKMISEGYIDEDGNKTGIWKEYDHVGKLKAKGKYNKNRRNGRWEYYFANGSIEQEGEYVKGKYNGLWTFYYYSGAIWKEEEYFNGLEEGNYNEFDELGNILVTGEYFDGEREGKWIIQINDNKAEGKYVTGLMDGRWKLYYDNGSLRFEGSYVQGRPEGKHKYYYPNGNLKEEQFYSSGLRQRNWKKYSEDGILKITITYQNDVEYRINGFKVDLGNDMPTVIN